ncbi:hypothetical protein ACVIDN_000573 [Rhizobium brockwellii]
MAGRMKAHLDAVDQQFLAEDGSLFAGAETVAVPQAHDVERLAGGKDVHMARAGMVRMAVGDERLLDGPHRIDIKAAFRAIEPLRGGIKQRIRSHETRDSGKWARGQRAGRRDWRMHRKRPLRKLVSVVTLVENTRIVTRMAAFPQDGHADLPWLTGGLAQAIGVTSRLVPSWPTSMSSEVSAWTSTGCGKV